MIDLSFENQVYILIAALLFLIILQFILIIVISVRFEKLKKRQKFLNENFKMEPVDVLLENCLLKQTELGIETQKNNDALAKIMKERRKTFDKIAIVRYSSNPDDTGNLSFSVGITNMDSDGIVITGLQQESGTKVFVKSIKGGKSNDDLTRRGNICY